MGKPHKLVAMKKVIISFFLIFFVPLVSMLAEEDQRPRLAILPLENTTQFLEYDALCKKISEITTSAARFHKDQKLIEWKGLPPSHDLPSLSTFAEKYQLEKLYFGNLTTGRAGDLMFTVIEWDAVKRENIREVTDTAETVSQIFEAADRIIKKMAGWLGYSDIAFGSLDLQREGGIGESSLYLDGNLFSYPMQTLNMIPTGNYKLSLRQARLMGEKVVLERSIRIEAGKVQEVSYSIPPADPEEKEEFARLKENLETARENFQNAETFLPILAAFQLKTQVIDYDLELIEERDRQIEASEALASTAIKKVVEDLDSQFYQENAPFGDLAEEYTSLNSIITPQYQIDVIEEALGAFLTAPEKLLIADNAYLYVALHPDTPVFNSLKGRLSLEDPSAPSGAPGTQLLAFDPARKFAGAAHLAPDFCWAVDNRSRLYTYSPGDEAVQVWEAGMVHVLDIPIPGLAQTSPLRMDITISDEDIIYLFLDKDVHVFSSLHDPRLEEYPIRYTDLEEGLGQTFASLSWKPNWWQAEGSDRIHVSDEGNSRVLVVDSLGEIQREVVLGDFIENGDLWIDSFGYYYLCDSRNHHIRKYTPQGELLAALGQYGTERGTFSYPGGGAVDKKGNLYVADSFNNRVQIFQSEGRSLLFPQVGELHPPILRRIEKAKEGQRNIDALKRFDREDNVFSMALGGSLLAAGVAGAIIGYDVFSSLAVKSYNDYLTAAEANAVTKARESVDTFKTLGKVSLFTAVPLATVGLVYLVDGLLNTAQKNYIYPQAYRNIQNQDLDLLYSLDEENYRSPQAAQALGIWTSLVPGILSVGLTTIELILLFTDSEMDDFFNPLHYVNMGLIAIPPIGAHLYGGRLSLTLSIASLMADILAVGALLYYKDIPFQLTPQKASVYTGAAFDVSRSITSLTSLGGVFMLLAASSIRLAAGIFDARFGWYRALDNNNFKGRREPPPGAGEQPQPPTIGLNFVPLITPREGVGFLAQISW